jgi:nucleotide-binding universal stress UspA family protein
MARHSSVPLLLLRPAGDHAPPLEPAAPLRRVLVPLDRSEFSESVIEHAVRFARASGGRITLLHVVIPPYVLESPYIAYTAGADPELLGHAHREGEAYLEEVAHRLRRREVEVDTALSTSWTPASSILEHARNADLIAMTTQGKGGLERLLMGSVAEKIMHAAACPTLFFRPPAS